MAVTIEFSTAVPYISSNKVVEWELGMTFTNSNSGAADYYVSEFSTTLEADNGDFIPKRESAWTRANLNTMLNGLSGHWNAIFASQVASVITSPPDNPTPDKNYVIPS